MEKFVPKEYDDMKEESKNLILNKSLNYSQYNVVLLLEI